MQETIAGTQDQGIVRQERSIHEQLFVRDVATDIREMNAVSGIPSLDAFLSFPTRKWY
jgi:hypothetical protein